MSTRYQVLPPTAPVPAPDDVLEQLVRAGARKMLQDALEAEVEFEAMWNEAIKEWFGKGR